MTKDTFTLTPYAEQLLQRSDMGRVTSDMKEKGSPFRILPESLPHRKFIVRRTVGATKFTKEDFRP